MLCESKITIDYFTNLITIIINFWIEHESFYILLSIGGEGVRVIVFFFVKRTSYVRVKVEGDGKRK